ncbi:hypothetical protein EVAR_85143_1 [Eumeta japonica]|uniref:Uncharacterized protein n=1 Tax=Eumeta variegata TaxID=151549 RepID=A0A4C1XUM9_EUMVA|nr:hypothetical protein EVAR_85143_1 [Eumeta japonica]
MVRSGTRHSGSILSTRSFKRSGRAAKSDAEGEEWLRRTDEWLVNIFSDSKSSLEVLTVPKTYRPPAHEARRDISEIVAEGRAVRLFLIRAHAEIAGNERADEFARRAAFTKKTAAEYDRFPLSHAKKLIKAASLEEWQQ